MPVSIIVITLFTCHAYTHGFLLDVVQAMDEESTRAPYVTVAR